MQEIINLIINNGLGVVCVAYLIYFQATTMKDIQKTMNEMTTTLEVIKEELKDFKSSSKRKGE